MAASPEQWITSCSNTILAFSALYTAHQLFKDHRAPAVGFFLIGCSAVLCALPPLLWPYDRSVLSDLEFAGEVLAPPLLSFGFLWLSEDRATAHVMLIGCGLLPAFRDWLSRGTVVLATRCSALSSLSCSLTVCLFTGNASGMLATLALSLSAALNPRTGLFLVPPGAAGGLGEWLLKGSVAAGCLLSKRALSEYLLELREWD